MAFGKEPPPRNSFYKWYKLRKLVQYVKEKVPGNNK
jgi:hypothetical protein